MMRHLKVIKDPERIKMSLEENRSEILSLLKGKEMTISQIAESLEKDYTTIFRHIKKLEKAGLLEVKRKKWVKRNPEKVYGRTADIFIPCAKCIDTFKDIKLFWDMEQAENTALQMEQLGFDNHPEELFGDEIFDFFSHFNKNANQILDEGEIDIVELDFLDMIRLKFTLLCCELYCDPNLSEKADKIFSERGKEEND